VSILRLAFAALTALALTACTDAAATSATSAASAASATGALADSVRDALIARADLGRIDGREAAKVWMVVISDFQCPFCKRWHEQTMPQLINQYVRSGQVRIAYLNLPIASHRNAQPAHEAAMCAAEQGAFWPVADALFATQNEWKSKFDVEPYFDSLATRQLRDAARFRRCLRDGTLRALIASDVSRVTRLGIGSTPTFLIGSQMLVGAQPYAAFARALDAALAEQGKTDAPGGATGATGAPVTH
jgi:protein-disulfide isomerase